jgi:hypothetical protein
MHGPLPLPLLHRFFTARYDTKMYFDEKRDHVELFDNWATVYLLNKYKLSFTTTLTRVLFEGPAIVHFEVFTDLGRIRLLKTLVPPREFEVYSEDRWVRAGCPDRVSVRLCGGNKSYKLLSFPS